MMKTKFSVFGKHHAAHVEEHKCIVAGNNESVVEMLPPPIACDAVFFAADVVDYVGTRYKLVSVDGEETTASSLRDRVPGTLCALDENKLYMWDSSSHTWRERYTIRER